MELALTGATGFVGSALLDLAVAEGHAVRALTRREQPGRSGIGWVRGDLADHGALAELCAGADAVAHVAGVVNAADAAGFERGNVTGTAAIVEAATKAGVRRFVHVSSLSAREPALSDYGRSKLAGEAHVNHPALDWAIVRPPAIYGPRDTEMFDLFRAARLGVVPLPPEGRASMIHVADLARLLLLLAIRPEPSGTVYEVDDGHPGGWSHDEMARMIGQAMGRRVLPLHVPRRLLTLAAMGDRMLRGARAKLTPDRVGYMTHPDWVARAAMRPPATLWQAWIATPDGLRETAQWYRDAGWL